MVLPNFISKQQELIFLLAQLEAETTPALDHTDQDAIFISWARARQLASDLDNEIRIYKKNIDEDDRLLGNIHEGFWRIKKIINSVDIAR